MSRLVDADELLLNNTWLWYDENGNHTIAGEAIENAPTVDAVEVIRCENCRWFGEEDEDGKCWCFFNDVSTLRHGFCNFGEEKKDGKR